MDNNYFIISTTSKTVITIYYYEHTNLTKKKIFYPVCFLVPLYNFDIIILLLVRYIKICNCSTEHKIYLGREIFKAQISLNLCQKYIQN
uniref:Uncharacterized protein n=1 Tax=Vertebrata australis TaxID=1967852 RepID=A0A1Z1MI60_9FLOR|nr:hypothetical protein [Vertebrata australis]ARW65758.1 hypothetical protein [Vertebrata australis]